jgi:purine nucleosidase/pyrimidine-specific ribonucleoside hydrolase
MAKKKILLDTDIGDDIDDAFALALALEMPEIELIGVTTVFRDTLKRARIARLMLDTYGRSEIPVYAGMTNLDPTNHTPCQYSDDMGDGRSEPLNAENIGQPAVDFILESVRKYGADLTLVFVGPFTNLAAALRQDPQTMAKAGAVFLMGGTFKSHFAEWNVLCDVEAAAAVMESGLDVTCVGLDVTRQTTMNDTQVSAFLNADADERGRLLATLLRRWIANTGRSPMMHDPLTLYAVACPDIIETVPTHVRVETKGEYTRGMTVNMDSLYFSDTRKARGPVVNAAVTVQAEKFMDELVRLVKRP